MKFKAVISGVFFTAALLLVGCLKPEETFPPNPPAGVFAQAGDGQVRVSWNTPALPKSNSDVAKVTHFKAWAVPDTLNIYQDASKFCTADMPDTTCVIKGLSNGSTYHFVVSAFNNGKDQRTCENHPGSSNQVIPAQGQSCASLIVSATPSLTDLPGAPTGVTGVAGNTQVTLSWAAPASNGGLAITGYKAYAVSAYAVWDTTTYCMTTGALNCVIKNLKNGTAYTFAVIAINSEGMGPPSTTSAAVTPGAAPGPPTAVSALAGYAEATVSWTAPASNGGFAIKEYEAYALEDTTKICVTTGALSCTIFLLSSGTTYTFAVKATNAIGTGVASAPTPGVNPAGLPTWTGRTSGTVNTLNGVSKTGGTFVAVGQAGTILTSTTGLNWTVRTSGTTNALRAVAGSDSLWVAVGASGTILTSPTGTTWTSRTSGTTSSINGIVHTGTQWVAVTAAGGILTSVDGVTWAARTSGTTSGLAGVTWSGSLLAAVGAAGSVLTSPDGVTWTLRVTGTTGDFNSIAWTGNAFVAVGGSTTPQVYSSSNGILWTQRATAASSGTTLSSVTWTGTRLLIVGSNGAVLSAVDAGTSSTYLTTLTGNQHGVVGTSGIWVVVGDNGTITTSP